MKITIDTREDSHEDICEVIELLQRLVGEYDTVDEQVGNAWQGEVESDSVEEKTEPRDFTQAQFEPPTLSDGPDGSMEKEIETSSEEIGQSPVSAMSAMYANMGGVVQKEQQEAVMDPACEETVVQEKEVPDRPPDFSALLNLSEAMKKDEEKKNDGGSKIQIF